MTDTELYPAIDDLPQHIDDWRDPFGRCMELDFTHAGCGISRGTTEMFCGKCGVMILEDSCEYANAQVPVDTPPATWCMPMTDPVPSLPLVWRPVMRPALPPPLLPFQPKIVPMPLSFQPKVPTMPAPVLFTWNGPHNQSFLRIGGKLISHGTLYAPPTRRHSGQKKATMSAMTHAPTNTKRSAQPSDGHAKRRVVE